MSFMRGLRRLWVFASVIWVLITGIVCGEHIYRMHKEEAEAQAAVAAETENVENPKKLQYAGGQTPVQRLAQVQEEKFYSMTLGPLAVVGPPIVIYVLGVSLLWVAAGFRNDVPAGVEPSDRA